MQPPPAQLKAQVLASARATPSPTRRAHVRQQALLLSLYALLFLLVSAARGSSPWLARPGGYTLVSALTFGAFVVFGLQRLAGFLTAPLGPPRARLQLLTQALLPSLTIGALLANATAPETIVWPIKEPSRHLLCPALLLLVGVVFVWLLTRVLRGSDPVRPRVTALAIGSTAGATAALAVTLQCHLADPLHAIACHVLPVALLLPLSRKLASRVAP